MAKRHKDKQTERGRYKKVSFMPEKGKVKEKRRDREIIRVREIKRTKN